MQTAPRVQWYTVQVEIQVEAGSAQRARDLVREGDYRHEDMDVVEAFPTDEQEDDHC